jgi:phosphate transport system substrate-binding protein
LKNKKLIRMSTLVIAGLLVLGLALVGCGGNGGPTTISMAGSTTVQPLAEDFEDAYEAIDDTVDITVAGGGSSVGVESAGEGTVDIGMASRAVKTEEFDTYPDLVVHHIASDGIAIATDSDTSVDVPCLTVEEVALIFGGNITNWAEVGGVDAEITVIAREEGSGTRAAFEELVLEDYGVIITEDALLFPSNGTLRTAVAETPYSIGFLSFGYLDETVDAFAMDDGEGCVEATVANALSGDYPVVRPLNLLTNGEPTGKVDEFITWILGTAGQAIVAESYIPVI